jgi:hypothetical protein
VKLVIFLSFLLSAFAVHASERDQRNLRMCEEAAVLATTAHILHPVNAQERVNFINEEKDRLAKDDPDSRPEDPHLLSALAAVTFHLVELEALNSAVPLSKQTQMRLAARAGAGCGLVSSAIGAP